MAGMTWRRTGIAAAIVGLIAFIAFGAIFQDGIARFLATPRAPFQTVAPPPPPDYTTVGSWLRRPASQDASKSADVFYVHSTTFYRGRQWNAPVDDPEADRTRRLIAAPNEVGPFAAAADVWAPRYREATLFSQFTHKYDGLSARQLAYGDVKRAFGQFLSERDPERIVILVGYGQGGLHIQGLFRDFFQGEFNPLRRRLAAAYVIGAATTADSLSSLSPALPVCDDADAVRCIVSYIDFEKRFDEEMRRIRNRSLVWSADGGLRSVKDASIVCVNPLSWSVDEAHQPADRNIGAASATGIAAGAPPPPIPRAVGAQCVDGILVVDTPARRILRRGDWFGDKWRAQPFNLFYYDLARNAETRIAALQALLDHEPEPLAPIDEAVDVDTSPINKVPH